MSENKCPLPKRSQLRAARSQGGEDNPTTGAISLGDEPPPPPPSRPVAPPPEPPEAEEPSSVSEADDPTPVHGTPAFGPDGMEAITDAPDPDASDEETLDAHDEPASSPGKRGPNVHPVGYLLRALLVLGLAGSTIAVPMTGRVGSDSSLTVPARTFGTSVGGGSWASSQILPQATALDATLTANSRAKTKAPVSITGCAVGTGADGNRSVRVVADTIYWPLAEGTYTITSPFTMRISPVSGQLLAHEGIDMAAPLDTPITSVYGGVVEEVAENSRSGAYVQIKHTLADGTVFHSAYLHQYMNKIKVKVGDTVTAGQVIGAVGSNGWSTGPHLHFEIHDSSDTPVDPEAWMAAHKAVYLGQESCS